MFVEKNAIFFKARNVEFFMYFNEFTSIVTCVKGAKYNCIETKL